MSSSSGRSFLHAVVFYGMFFMYLCNLSSRCKDVLDTNYMYRRADKSLARLTFRCILFDGENISFDAILVIYTGCPRRKGQYSGRS